MTDTIRCRCGYTVNGHCSRCESVDAGPVTLIQKIKAAWVDAVPLTVFWITLAMAASSLATCLGCPGQSEETAPGDPETCCACLYDAFPEVGEPCIYESANSCQGHVKAGIGPDTWGVCLAELCGDVCDGVGPFDVIRWEP